MHDDLPFSDILVCMITSGSGAYKSTRVKYLYHARMNFLKHTNHMLTIFIVCSNVSTKMYDHIYFIIYRNEL